MVTAGQSGMIYNFFMYGGKHSAGAERYGAEDIVQVQNGMVLKNLFYVLSKNSPNIKIVVYILIIGSQRFHF